ncbi:hypothetical protein CBS101457_002066 [Exobasidium rhododendri]|nr:hypothetical protein CBS101457_002066 [Exobasidium rhododendri]
MERNGDRAHALPQTSFDQDPYLGLSSRPVSSVSATNIIALYASTDSLSENGQYMTSGGDYQQSNSDRYYENETPPASRYPDQNATIKRPLPPPPNPSTPSLRTVIPIRSPLPRPPGSASQQHNTYAQRGSLSSSSAYDYEYYEPDQSSSSDSRSRVGVPSYNTPIPREQDAARYYTQPTAPHQQSTSIASSSNTSRSNDTVGYSNGMTPNYAPQTPPPWSPGLSVRSISLNPSPSTSFSPQHQHSQSIEQQYFDTVDYNGEVSASGSRNNVRADIRIPRKMDKVESLGSTYAETTIDAEWEAKRLHTHQPFNRSRSIVGSTMMGGDSRNFLSSSSSHRGVPLPTLPLDDRVIPQRQAYDRSMSQNSHQHREAEKQDQSTQGPLMTKRPTAAAQGDIPRPLTFQQDDYKDPGFIDEHGTKSLFVQHSSSGDWALQQHPLESEDVQYSLLSNIALLLRESIPRGVQIKGSVSYPYSFTGKDVVSTIQAIIPKEVLAWTEGLESGDLEATGERRIALLVAKSLKGQLFFHEVDWGTGELDDGVEEVYMFLEDSLAGSGAAHHQRGQANDFDVELSLALHGGSDLKKGATKKSAEGLDDLPTGVFTAMTDCYSPLCGKPDSPRGAFCYSVSCPRARPNGVNRNTLTSASHQLDTSKSSGNIMGNSHMALAWADTVPKEFLASIPKAEVKRQNAILELIQKEEEFLHDLELLDNLFLARLERPNALTGDPPPIAIGVEREDFIREVFSNHRELVGHISKLVERLHVRQREENPIINSIGDIFLDAALEWGGAFETNMTNFPLAKNRILREASINPRFKDFLEVCRREPACHRLPMDNFLQRATTRLPRYNLHFKSILQDTEASNSDRESLTRAIEIVDEQCKSIQKGVASAEVKVKIREYAYNLSTKRNKAAVHMDLLNPERQLTHQGRVYRKPQVTDFEWQDLLAVLFDNYLVVTKAKRREEGENVSSKFVLAKRPIPVEMIQLIGFQDPSVSRSIGLSNFHLRSNSEKDFRDLYPFTIAHIGGKMEPLTLYVPSKLARDEWKVKLQEAMGLRAAVQEANKVFESHIVSADVFALPLASSLDLEKPPVGVDSSLFHGVVTCAVPFQTMDGRRLIAIGCADGVWIGLRNDSRSLRKVLHLKLVSQCAVLENFGIFIVLADKVLISYSLEALVPGASTNANPRPPQKLSGNRDVLFFSVGQLKERTLLVYMKKKANESVFRALEPIASSIQTTTSSSKSSGVGGGGGGGGGLFGKFHKDAKNSDWFRIYKTFFIPSEAYSMQFLRSKLCIVCARGFEIINLDSLLPGTIPDFSQSARDDPRIQQLAKRVETAKPLGMFKNSDSEFLLCYDAFACYVDRLGGPIRLDNIIEWEGLPRSVAFRSPFILAFDQRFIEVRDSSSGQLVQLIRTNDLKNISGSSTTTSSMESEEDDDAILLVQRVRNNSKQKVPSYDLQQVFQLVSTAYFRQASFAAHSQQLQPQSPREFVAENNALSFSIRGRDLSRMATNATTRTFGSATTTGTSGGGSVWI